MSLSDETGTEYEPSTVPNVFIDHYSTIADKLKSEIPTSQQNPESYLKNKAQQSFFMTPINYKEVEDVIDDLKENGNNPHTIASSVLKSCKHIIIPLLCHLINLFVQQGYFPENLKIGCITPIFKRGIET